MNSSLAVLALGFVLGVRHASDPDHVVAVAAIAARYRRIAPAALVGAVWGLGHSVTVFLAGGAIVLFNLVVPPRVGLALEFGVGLALALVGALNVFGQGGFARPAPADARASSWRAFGLGLVHGLAGSAAVALLVLATVRDARVALLYLLVFCLGTIAGMVLVTLGLAAPVRVLGARWPGLGAPLRYASGALALVFGVYVLYTTGFRDGLFAATPHWTPR
jgi:high-affinity nickel-transport protein